MSFVALRLLSLSAFGSVAVIVLLYTLSLRVARSITGVPMLIRYTDADEADHRMALGQATGTSLVIGVLLGAVVAIASSLADQTTQSAMTVLAVMLPFLLVQDGYRHGYFSAGRPDRALWLDTVWLVSTLLALSVVVATGSTSVALVVASWAGAGTIAATAGAIMTRTLPRPAQAGAWLRQQSDLAMPLLGEQVLGAGSRQAVLFFIAAYGGLEALGGIQGARTLFGPLNILFLGTPMFVVPEVVRLTRIQSRRVWRFTVAVGSVLVLAAVGLGVLLIVARDPWMVRLVGPNWHAVQTYIVPIAVATGAMGMIVVVRSGFRGMEMPLASLQSTITLAILRTTLGIGATVINGVLAGAFGLALANSLGAVGFLRSFSRKTRNLYHL